VKLYDTMTEDEAAPYVDRFVLVGMPTVQQGRPALVTATIIDPAADGTGIANVKKLTEPWASCRWYVTEARIMRNETDQQDFTHVAVCERQDDKALADPIYVNDILLHRSFIVLPMEYTGGPEQGHPVYWHCPHCVRNAVLWLYQNQEAWHAQAGSRRVQEATQKAN
jgi:hypothetical protein